IHMAPRKELNFFSLEENWARGRSWYEQQFAGAGDTIAVGEATPKYTWYPMVPGVPERIAATVPDVKLVYLMREPVERMRSEYAYRYARAWEHRPIREALSTDADYRHRSSYAMQIGQYLERFDRSKILLIVAEDLRDRRAETVRRTLEFLGVRSDWVPPSIGVEANPPSDRRPTWLFRKIGRAMFKTEAAMGRPSPTRRRVSPRLQRLMSRPIPREKLALDDATRAKLRDLMRSDVAKLAPLMPPGFDGWGLL
ncbi:MAG: sulfotransferase domain-containing protein, partial [Actinomycetota bacterium]